MHLMFYICSEMMYVLCLENPRQYFSSPAADSVSIRSKSDSLKYLRRYSEFPGYGTCQNTLLHCQKLVQSYNYRKAVFALILRHLGVFHNCFFLVYSRI